MRIRKCAARLLGAQPAGLDCAPPPQPRAWDSEASSSTAAAAGLLCELNRSPWDDLMCVELMASCGQQEEEDGGILGNGVKPEAEEARGIPGNPINYEADAISSLAKGGTSMRWFDEKAKARAPKKEMAKTRRKKKKDNNAAVAEVSTSCKKSDGKGWHCKRRAQHPHSLCNYHLAQLRSYSSSYGHDKVVATEGHDSAGSWKKKSGTAGADSSFYYYYSGFGPWRGKTRGGGGSNDEGDRRSRRTAADEEDGEEISESGNGYGSPVAGEDEEEESDYGEEGGNSGRGGKEGRKEDRKSYRKRGRKRMKARSLKSLL